MLAGHGDNAYLFKHAVMANFSSNVYYKGPSKGLINHISLCLKGIATYPEVKGETVTDIMAKQFGLSSVQVQLTNGATEAFYLIALAYKNQTSDIFVPSFAEYEDACKIHGHQINYVSNTLMNEDYTSSSKLVWLCNPNNPDGKILSKNDLTTILQRNRDTIFVLDEAYIDFTIYDVSMVSVLNDFDNLIIVRSLTKKFAIPGLRLGYLLTSQEIATKIEAVRSPWSVNALAIEAAKYILHDKDYDFPINEMYQSCKRMQKHLSVLNGVKVIPSETTFFIVELPINAKDCQNYLLANHGFLVRDASNFKGLTHRHIRISIQDEYKNQKLIDALSAYLIEFFNTQSK